MSPLIVPAQLASLERYHRDGIASLFGASPPLAPITGSLRFLFICFTNRCGSNYLAHLLASNGVLNEAGEFFNAATVSEHARAERLRSLAGYVDFLGRRVSMSGWLAAKIGIEQLVMLTEAGVLESIRDRSRFILIERRDRVAQAVSRLVAEQNYQWTSEQRSRLPDDQLVYSRAALDAHCRSIDMQNHMFFRYFASNGIAPLHLAYETIVAAPDRQVKDIGAWLALPGLAADPARIRLAAQDSPLKRAWAARYRAGE